VALDRRGSASPLWHADNNGSSPWHFSVRYFPQELQVEIQSLALLTCHVVEKVHNVSSKPILEPTAFIEVERAYRIHFDIRTFAQDRTQFTLESKRSLAHLCHGERNNAIRHSSGHWGTGEDARRSAKTRSIAGLPAWRSATDERLNVRVSINGSRSGGRIPSTSLRTRLVARSATVYSGLIPAAAIILPVTPFSAR
jgi:hypothetical protein